MCTCTYIKCQDTYMYMYMYIIQCACTNVCLKSIDYIYVYTCKYMRKHIVYIVENGFECHMHQNGMTQPEGHSLAHVVLEARVGATDGCNILLTQQTVCHSKYIKEQQSKATRIKDGLYMYVVILALGYRYMYLYRIANGYSCWHYSGESVKYSCTLCVLIFT